MNRSHYLYSFLLLLTIACRALSEPLLLNQTPSPAETTPAPRIDPANIARATYQSTAVNKIDQSCSGNFIIHQLDHTTTVPGGDEVRMFEANGGGVAINDLDNDGDLDVVLANHAGPNTILWNEEGLNFRTEHIGVGDSRAVNIVDVDGDGLLDILFTRRASAPNYWRNEGDQHFAQTTMRGVDKPLYSINWADLDGDTDLDFVGGTYDAGLLTDFGVEFLASGAAGVYYYENQDGRYKPTRLAEGAQAMALILPDLNGDGAADIVVGNDFGVPDYAWLRQDDGWLEAPFSTMSHSTMSLAQGDIDNSGTYEIFSTDMMPYSDDPQTEAAWAPVMEAMMEDPHLPDDPQIMANVLQTITGTTGYADTAPARGLEATGWSWSSKFGDLDQDGFLDLYVVNGFIEYTTFSHLPDHELVEENQALRNTGDGNFAPATEWGLGSTESGRGMSMADLDNDGDLDIVVNNLRGPAQLFENQLCSGDSLQVDLLWPSSGNTAALGAELALHTSQGTLHRTVTAASGYLSGDPARVHFGFPEDTELHWLEIHWPDGKRTIVEYLDPGTLITINRG
jgi:uncharacterized protein YuzB (UPF0349 family)